MTPENEEFANSVQSAVLIVNVIIISDSTTTRKFSYIDSIDLHILEFSN